MTSTAHLEIASLIVEDDITTLTTEQAEYLRCGFEQLPKWCQDIIYQYINSGVWSDEYSELGKERLKKATEAARDIISTDILTLGKMPLSKLISLAGADTSESYEEIVKKVCEKASVKFLDPYICNEITLRDFRHEDVAEEASLAIYDCDQLLSQIAYAGELASFRRAITTRFPSKYSIGREIKSYTEAIEMIADIAKDDSYRNHHYRKAVALTIVGYVKMLEKRVRNGEDVLCARKRILFENLPIDASIQDIAWAINTDWLNLELSVKLANSDIRRELLCLGYRKMEDLINNPIDPVHAKLKTEVEESLRYIFG